MGRREGAQILDELEHRNLVWWSHFAKVFEDA